MNIIIEYKLLYLERCEISDIIDKTLKEYVQKFENSPWDIEYKYNIQFFDKNKNKTKNMSTKRGLNRTIIASNGRYHFIRINNFLISIKGEIKKDVLSTYMKCYNMPLLWRKFFLIIANNKDYIVNYCKRPLKKLDRHL